jgi:hypothetical protein
MYRALRSINPSLIYFDYGDFKIFASPASTKDRKAEIHPTGTLKEQVMMKRRNTSQRIIPEDNIEHACWSIWPVTI